MEDVLDNRQLCSDFLFVLTVNTKHTQVVAISMSSGKSSHLGLTDKVTDLSNSRFSRSLSSNKGANMSIPPNGFCFQPA